MRAVLPRKSRRRKSKGKDQSDHQVAATRERARARPTSRQSIRLCRGIERAAYASRDTPREIGSAREFRSHSGSSGRDAWFDASPDKREIHVGSHGTTAAGQAYLTRDHACTLPALLARTSDTLTLLMPRYISSARSPRVGHFGASGERAEYLSLASFRSSSLFLPLSLSLMHLALRSRFPCSVHLRGERLETCTCVCVCVCVWEREREHALALRPEGSLLLATVCSRSTIADVESPSRWSSSGNERSCHVIRFTNRAQSQNRRNSLRHRDRRSNLIAGLPLNSCHAKLAWQIAVRCLPPVIGTRR